jgi:hypothetical protein
MDAPFEITLQIVLTVLAGITAQVVGEFLKVPSIIFLLVFGIGLGPDGLAWLAPQSLGVGLEVLVSLSVAIILFEGGLSLELKELGQVSDSLRNLVTTGVFITLLGGGMAAHWLGEFPWSLAFLYASLVVVTGPTVINPLLRQVKVDRKVATILEGEGVLVDPVGAILAVVVLDIVLSGGYWPPLHPHRVGRASRVGDTDRGAGGSHAGLLSQAHSLFIGGIAKSRRAGGPVGPVWAGPNCAQRIGPDDRGDRWSGGAGLVSSRRTAVATV